MSQLKQPIINGSNSENFEIAIINAFYVLPYNTVGNENFILFISNHFIGKHLNKKKYL